MGVIDNGNGLAAWRPSLCRGLRGPSGLPGLGASRPGALPAPPAQQVLEARFQGFLRIISQGAAIFEPIACAAVRPKPRPSPLAKPRAVCMAPSLGDSTSGFMPVRKASEGGMGLSFPARYARKRPCRGTTD